MIYVIDTIRTKSGDAHEREVRRKGHRVSIDRFSVGAPLLAEYIDEENVYLHTSPVEDFYIGKTSLVVWTQNSTYRFRKIDEGETK